MSRAESSSSQTQPFLLPLEKKASGEEKAARNKGDNREARQMKGSKRKLLGLRQHSFSVRHLLFYCNLMALLSPGASRQSPLYHMAIISVAPLCDSLTLSAVTCDPSQPNQLGDAGRARRETKERERGRRNEGERETAGQ